MITLSAVGKMVPMSIAHFKDDRSLSGETGTTPSIIPSLVELVAFIAGCFLTDVVCNAFNLVPGCMDPPSAYGSVKGIKLGRGILCVTSGDLAKSNELFY